MKIYTITKTFMGLVTLRRLVSGQKLESQVTERGNYSHSKKLGFTLAEIFLPSSKIPQKVAFTLAEVLITLGVIGVVAAITMPTLIENYKKVVYVNSIKASMSILSNGFRSMLAKEEVEKLTDTSVWAKLPNGFSTNNSTNMMDFNREFCKYFKCIETSNRYSRNSKADLFYNRTKYRYLNGEDMNQSTGKYGYKITLADGIVIGFQGIKNPANVPGGDIEKIRALGTKFVEEAGSIYVDTNGDAKPNVVGKDLFLLVISNDGMLYPYGGEDFAKFNAANYGYGDWKTSAYYWSSSAANTVNYSYRGCGTQGGKPIARWNGEACLARIIEQNWKMDY